MPDLVKACEAADRGDFHAAAAAAAAARAAAAVRDALEAHAIALLTRNA